MQKERNRATEVFALNIKKFIKERKILKNSNFKKVLALVLSLAMVLSVCLTGFAVSAETAEVDLSYCVVNDTAMKTWRANNENMALANYDGKTVYRIAPQKASTGLLPFSSKVDLTASQAASINTVAYFVSNEFGSDLEVGFQYYGSNGTHNAFLGGGYIYLLDDKTGDILPVYATKGNATIPAGFKGYVVYDLSNADNYGNGDWKDSDGNPVKSVNAFKDNCFKPLMLRANYTENMIGKAWYVGDLTVSTKAVEDFAKQLSGLKVVSFNFNTASVRSYEEDEAMNYWNDNGKFDTTANGHAEIVDFDGFEGKGSKFTIAKLLDNDGKVAIRNDFVQSRGSGLPFAIEKAKGIRIELKKTGDVGFFLAFNSNKDTFAGKYYLVSDGGAVSTAATVPADFCGTAYFVFDEKAVMVGKSADNAVTWEEYINSKTGDYNLSSYSGTSGAVGDSITFGSFSFIYDAKAVTDYICSNNWVLSNASDVTDAAVTSENHSFTVVDNENSYGGKEIQDITLVSQSADIFKTTVQSKNIPSPEKVNAIAFRVKVPNFNSSAAATVKYRFTLNDGNASYDHATYGTTATLINYDGTVTAGTVSTGETAGMVIPDAFDGIIVLDVSGEGKFKVSGNATSFADYATSKAISNIQIWITNKWNQVAGDVYTIDDFMLIYEDKEQYINKVSAENASNIYNRSYVVNNASGRNGMTGSAYNMFGANDAAPRDTTGMHVVENTSVFALTIKGAGDAGQPTFLTRRGEQIYGTSVNFKNTKAVSYWVSIPKLDEGKHFSFQLQFSNYAKFNGLSYAISDDGKTVLTANDGAFKLNGFTGRLYFIIDENAVIKYNSTEYSWQDWYDYRVTEAKYATPVNGFYPYISRNFTDISTEEKPLILYFDDFRFHFNDSMLKDAVANATKALAEAEREAAEKEAAEKLIINNATTEITSAAHLLRYNAAIDTQCGAPSGSAYHFTPKTYETDEEIAAAKPAYVYGFANNSVTTQEELLDMKALVYWLKVPEGTLKSPSLYITDQKYQYSGTMLLYNTLTNELQLFDSTKSIKGAFEGYVIFPLENAKIRKSYTPTYYSSFAEFVLDRNLSKAGVGQYVTDQNWTDNRGEYWMGDIRYVNDWNKFFTELGVERNAGDVNADGEVDIRDTVRYKKYNANAIATGFAFHNADVDNNGLFEANIDMAASRKQNLGVGYEVLEKDASLVDYPDVMVGFYHGDYGVWDYYAGDIAPESDVLNTYTSHDMYSLTQMKQNGGAAWMYISKSFAGEPVFGTKDGGYDNAATEINKAWKTALDDAINEYKAQGIWNQVAGFHTEEILMSASKYMSQSQYATMTKYLRDTYGKRVLAVLSTYEVNGNPDYAAGAIPAATPETYANVTDIGYDMYHIDTDDEKESFISIFNSLKEKTGNRTDVKYWLLPTTYCGKTAEGEPSRTDESIATEVAWFDDLFANTDLIPESQRGGILFYTFRTFYDGGYDYPVSAGNFGSFGLDKLMSEYNYTLTAKAIADMASKYVK